MKTLPDPAQPGLSDVLSLHRETIKLVRQAQGALTAGQWPRANDLLAAAQANTAQLALIATEFRS